MKELIKNKYFEVNLVKGFVLGIGLNDSNTNFILFVGPIVIEFIIKRKKKNTF
jgi:hypothetical protein